MKNIIRIAFQAFSIALTKIAEVVDRDESYRRDGLGNL